MATGELGARKNNRRKLVLNEKVEVRSLEEGFLGSWHAATVISAEDLVRTVKYDHLLSDDSSDNLIEDVKVTPIIDGVSTGVVMPKNYRGVIRPLPPTQDLGTRCLLYGQCVDFFHEDAWWEGVIFDHQDGHKQRKIFFPDMGDEMAAEIQMLRLTQDWNEFTGEWEPRGNWLFLELIESVKEDLPLPVSIKQIWYEVRVKEGFECLQDWTSRLQNIWREMVLKVLFDNVKITVEQLLKELNTSMDMVKEGLRLEFPKPVLDSILNQFLIGYILRNSREIVPLEESSKMDRKGMLLTIQNETSHHHFEEKNRQDNLTSILKVRTNGEDMVCLPLALPILSPNPDEASGTCSNNHNEAAPIMCSDVSHMEIKSSTWRKKLERKNKLRWRSAVPDLVPGAEFCPDAIVTCHEIYGRKKVPSSALLLNSRKHLLHLGWKIEFVNEGNRPRLRYFSPNGKLFYSFHLVCLELGSEVLNTSHCNEKRIVSSADNLFSYPPVGNLQSCSKLSKVPCPSDGVCIESQPCPQAVKDYLLLGLDDKDFSDSSKMDAKAWNMTLKAMKHLTSVGWLIRERGQRKFHYCSPDGRSFYSLLSACKLWEEIGGLSSRDDPLSVGAMRKIHAIKDSEDKLAINGSCLPSDAIKSKGHFPPSDHISRSLPAESSGLSTLEGLVKLGKVELQGANISKKGRKRKQKEPNHIDCSHLLKKGRKSCRSIKVRSNGGEDSSTPILRSSKRARELVSSSFNRTPRTVLSWLIDKNVVLPRAKVQYRCRKDGRPMAEGRIMRDGIKCSCCQKIFTLSNFESHAGSTNHRPSANIFLEDGRSLLECQLQLRRQNSNKHSKPETQMNASQICITNDYICSVCHYGGELVLCDNCPSSFHTHCVGLTEVPDGDWFCPTCCCGICGHGGFDKNKERFTKHSVLICAQCEHQYHVGCLRNKGFESLDDYPKGHWFCRETCGEIFRCLRNILGRAFPVGTDNLTWTLMKCIKADSHDHNAFDKEFLMESYSKLSVALSVMHECFEPVKEPHARRDLMEDVIFNRWSELNRLNCQGFYTVLLERNDELISVATIRIYGKKVAEVPLVATRFKYRRLGMCRILMNELEKKLIELGVERLVLPAVPNVLSTWTTSFGFSIMKESERLNFLDNTFLDFQDTVMCQKVLSNIPSSVSKLSTETHNRENDVKLDGTCPVSAISQAEVEESESESKGQGFARVSRGLDNENGNDLSQLAIVENQPSFVNSPSVDTGSALECPTRVTNNKQAGDNDSNGLFKCYKRRRISAC